MMAVRGPKAGLLRSGMYVPSVGRGQPARRRGHPLGTARPYCIPGANRRQMGRTMPPSPTRRHKPMLRTAFLPVISLLILVPAAHGQGKEAVLAGYTKYEYRIPMRDGVRLFTSVYVPKDDSTPYPILLDRTPYSVGPYGVDRSRDHLGPSPLFARERYIFAYQ